MSVGLLFLATIGVYIVMGTGMIGARHSTPTSRNTLQHANSTAKKMQVESAAPEPVSEAGEPILCRFCEHTASL